MREEIIEMTQRKINRYHTIKNSLEGKITVAEAAETLGISERQVIRLRNGVKKEGALSLTHKNKGRASVNALSDEFRTEIVKLYTSEAYTGSNFQHFTELINEGESITISYPTVYRILTDAGIKSPKKRRKKKKHNRRKRMAAEGQMIQLDATSYEWFADGKTYALHGAIDDATGKLLGLYMTENECLFGYYAVMRQVIERNGVPLSAYADRHTIFVSPNKDKLTIEEQLAGKQVKDTQFGRAMKELGVRMISARSPQAKGRIERAWETLQSRLPIEMRNAGINNTEEANKFLLAYAEKFNRRFSVKPENTQSVYAPLKHGLDLDMVLCVKLQRTMDSSGVFSFQGQTWQMVDSPPGKATIDVIVTTSRGIFASCKNDIFDVVPYVKPAKITEPKPGNKTGYVPSENHPWRNGFYDTSPVFSNTEILSMLYELFLEKPA